MATVNINYKVFGAKQAVKEIAEVTKAAIHLEDALAKLAKRGIKLYVKVGKAK